MSCCQRSSGPFLRAGSLVRATAGRSKIATVRGAGGSRLTVRYASQVPPSQLGTSPPIPPIGGNTQLPAKSSFGRRLFWYTLTGTTIFYAGSSVAAMSNERYQDFFVESVPFGERIVDYLDTHDVISDVRGVKLGEVGSKARNLTKDAYGQIDATYNRLFNEKDAAVEKLKEGERDARQQLAEARERAKRRFDEVAHKAKSQLEPVKESAEEVEAKASSLLAKAKDAVGKAEASVRSTGASLLGRAEDAAAGAKTSLEQKLPASPSWGQPLPVDHQAPAGFVASSGDRKLQPPKADNTRLRDDPQAPKLPLLSPTIKSLSGKSEPVIAQLAGTIDELATFLRDTPTSGANARSVLTSAQTDLEKLSARVEQIKKVEAERVEKQLAAQAAKYDAELRVAEKAKGDALSTADTKWQNELEAERSRQHKEYESKLRNELATQSEIIDERLRKEVIAQGIELQRRWMRDLKSRVEEERGGRLAKLDELATDLKHLERISVENSSALEQNSDVHTLWATVRSVQAALDGDDGGEDVEGGASPSAPALKRPFRDEVRVLGNTSKARSDGVIGAALEVLSSSPCADEGVESLTTLSTWFTHKVAPRILNVSLVPTDGNAGVLAHLASAALAPILFRKKGLAQGDDVPAVLARAEWYLERKRLDDAAREVNQLKGWPKTLAKDWLEAARKRLEVQQALEVIQTEASLSSLRVA